MNQLGKIVIAVTLLFIHGTYGVMESSQFNARSIWHNRLVAVNEIVPTKTVAVRPGAALSEDSQPAKPCEGAELEKIAEIEELRKRLAGGDRSGGDRSAALEMARRNALTASHLLLAVSPMSSTMDLLLRMSAYNHPYTKPQ